MQKSFEEILADFDDLGENDKDNPEEISQAKNALRERCKLNGFSFKEEIRENGITVVEIGIKCAREQRKISITSLDRLKKLLSISFEEISFISGFEAICSYTDGTIEASVRPFGRISTYQGFRKLFGRKISEGMAALGNSKISIPSPQVGMPEIEISRASETFQTLSPPQVGISFTIKINGCSIENNDQASRLLKKLSDSVFFQIDLMVNSAFGVERQRQQDSIGKKLKSSVNLSNDLQYPKTEYDEAPMSLYWYGRGASGLPLLQFLAFYQVLEFYYPSYSEVEARRKIKTVLKDPVFRGDRDVDISRLLSTIRISRTGNYGDERSQLRATITECIDADGLRAFLTDDQERCDFFSSKTRSHKHHKIPIATPIIDLRADVSERIYGIRCKIVHTKADSRDADVEPLLPFSNDAEQLRYDIELVEYIARQVLIAASSSIN